MDLNHLLRSLREKVRHGRPVLLAIALFLSAAAIFSVAADSSPRQLWKKLRASFAPVPANVPVSSVAQATGAPAKHNFRLQRADIQRMVAGAPLEVSGMRASASSTVLTLPLPDGKPSRFRLLESPIIAPSLARKFPDIKSYAAQGVDDPAATARFSWTSRGLHGVILGNDYSVFIHPVDETMTTEYVSYYAGQDNFKCDLKDEHIINPGRAAKAGVNIKSGATLRVYRLAIAAPAEYTNNPGLGGGSIASTVASFNIWVNLVNAEYERELAVRFTLVDNTSIIYTDAMTDPFTNPTSSSDSMYEVRDLLRTQVGVANYDLGHVLLSGDTGGVALAGVVCSSSGSANKGAGASGVGAPLGNGYGASRIMHETGHQFGALHTFNDISTCASNRTASQAYESGNGITIMAYPVQCNTPISTTREIRFHNGSQASIVNFIAGAGGTCGTTMATGNTPPTVSGGPDRTIPRNTPFTLVATGSDPDITDAASLSYIWEQIDAGGSLYGNTNTAVSFTDAGDPPTTTRPIFRPFSPLTNPSRTFPSLTYILNNANVPPAQISGKWTAENLPNVTRMLNFRITLRDNRANGGAFADDSVILNVDGNSGPFLVSAPNTAVSLPAGSMQTVTWSVNNTNLPPVSCSNVKISLSTDGGNSFPYVLAASVPNEGVATVTLPNLTATVIAARIKVESVGNIFFDISDANFTITSGPSCPSVSSFAPAAGNTGTSVKLYGTGLTGVTGVKFANNVTASFTVNNDTQITVTQPAGAVTGPITLIKPSCADTLTATYIVCSTLAAALQVDDNSSNQVGTGRYLVNRLTPSSYPATLQSVSLRFESSQNLPTGTPFILLAGVNADGDTNINNTGFQTMNAAVGALAAFVKYDLPTPITIYAGDFVIGYTFPNGGNTVLLDTTTPQNRSYTSSDGLNFTAVTSANYFIRAGYMTGCNLGVVTCPTVSMLSSASGQIGDTVTINGAGFSGVTAVTFSNNRVTPFTINSDTQITATVPTGAVSGPITLSKPNCSDAQSASFTINAPACPTVSSINPASALAGVPITITGTNLTGITVVKFSSDITAAFTVDSDTQITAIVPPGVGIGPITLSKQGCADVQTTNFIPCSSPLALQVDDGAIEQSSNFTGTVYLVSRLTPATYPATLTTVQLNMVTGSIIPVGTPITVLAGANTGGTSNINGISFQTVSATVTVRGQFVSYTLPSPITINSGDFVVGYSINSMGWWPEQRDMTSPQGRSYRSTNGSTFSLVSGSGNLLIRGQYFRPCCSAASITVNPSNPALPGGQLGAAYSQTFTQTGGAGTVAWSVSAGSLPAGLTLNAATGAITGTPTTTGTSNFTIRATDQSNCTGERAYSLAVACPAIAISPSGLPDGAVGVAYSQSLSALPSSSYTFAVTGGALPSGLMLDTSGALSGTPTQTGAFSFTVTATGFGGGCAGTRTYAVTIGCPVIAVSPGSLADGTVGAAYSQTITASGLAGSFTFAVTSGSLPPGLMLNTMTGAITGTPTTVPGSPFSFTITATNTASGCTGSQAYSITINCPDITVTAPATNSGTINMAFSATFTQTSGFGAVVFTTANTLPTGMTLAANGTLSGTPTQTGVFPITVTVTDANGCTGQQDYTLAINALTCVQAPANLTSWWRGEGNALDSRNVNNGTMQGSATFASGKVGQAFSFNGTNGYVALPDNFFPFPASGTGTTAFTFETWFKTSASGVILGQQDAATSPYAGVPAGYVPGLYVGSNGKLYVEMFWKGSVSPIISAANVNDGVFHHVAVVYNGTTETVYLDGVVAGSAAHTQTSFASGSYKYQFGTGYTAGWPNGGGGWSNFNGLIDEATLYSRALTAAEVQSIVIAGGLGKCCSLTISQATLPSGTVGVAYSQTLTASGGAGAYTYSASGTLPPGLMLSSGGVLSGTPTQAGQFSFTVSVSDQTNCTGTQAYTLGIDCPMLAVSPSTLPNATAGVAYSQTITTMPVTPGYSFMVSGGSLPTGLTLASGGGLSGTPTVTGLFSFTVTAANVGATCTFSRTYTVTVGCPTITLTPGSLPSGTAGVAYSQTILPGGSTGSYTLAMTGGSLPPGLMFNTATGVISGTPTQVGISNFTIRATDQFACFDERTYAVTITCPAITLSPDNLPDGTVSAAYSQALTAAPAGGNYSFAVTAGALPSGLMLAANGSLSGTLTQTGTFSFTVTATGYAGACTGQRAYVVTVGCPAITLSPNNLPNSLTGAAYNQTVTASGLGGSYTFAVSSGSLPPGLMLNTATGAITGMATTASANPYNFTITATNTASGCTGSQPYSVTISCAVITVNAPVTNSGIIGMAFSATFTQSGGFGAGSFTTASTLPTGVMLATNGALSGTPTQTGVFPITVNFTDGNGCTGQQSYTLTIGPQTCVEAPANLTSWWRGEGNALDSRNANNGTAQGSATFAAGKVGQAFSFNGTNGYVALPDNFFPFPASGTGTTPFTFETWFKTSTGGVIIGQQNTNPYTNPTGYVPGLYIGTNGKLHVEMFLNPSGINPIISASSVNDGVFHHVAVVYDGTTETVYLDGAVAGSAAHTQQSFTGPYKYQFGAGYTNGWPNGNGGWFNFNGLIDEATLYSRALTLAEIQSVVAAGSLGKCCSLAINPATLPSGTFGAAYSQTLMATGGAGTYTFTASGTLPPGLTLSSAGVLSGTPTQPGLFSFTVNVSDQTNCTGSQTYTVAIDCPVISLSPTILPVALVGATYNQSLVAAPAGSYVYTVTSGALPLGMTLTMTGDLSGAPIQSGIFNFTVTATNAAVTCTGSRAYQLLVDCPPIAISPSTLSGGTVGAAYSQMLTPSGIAGSYVFSTDENVLPPGLTLSGTGVLSGTPTQAGAYDISIRATHTGSGCFGIVSYTVTIVCPTISITPPTLAAGTVGAAYNQSLTANGGTAGYTFALAAGSSLPAGLSLGSGGAITGTPLAPGTSSFTVSVTDNYGCMGSALISLTINCQTITVSNPGLNTGTVGTAFTTTFTQTGGIGMTSFSTSSTLPTGLMLSSAGVLSGTPTQSGSFPITVVATDSNACTGASTGYTLTIACPAITVNPATLPPGAVGTAYSQTITPSGGTSANYTYSSTGTLPPGLTLSAGPSATGTLSGNPTAGGTYVFTIIATDANGCAGMRGYSVFVNSPPMFASVASPSRRQDAPTSNSQIATVSDNESTAGSLVVTVISANTSNGVTISNISNTGGTITADIVAICAATNASFTLQVSDGGLTTTATLNVTVTPENVAPTIAACPNNLTANTGAGNCTASVTFNIPTATDNCTTTPAVTCNPASGSTFALGVTTVTCTATDAASNTASCSFTVTVNDQIAPTISCPGNQSAGSAGGSVAVNYPAPTATDNCATTPTVTCNPASGSSFPVGITTVSCTAKDAANNMSSACTFTVTVTVNQFTPTPTISLTDPLVCTGPGNPVNGSFAVTNTSQISQTGTITVALPAGLVGIPNSCAANVGTCVVSANSVIWSGTLTPGQTISASYHAQLGDVPTGTQLCAQTTAVFGINTASVTACMTVNCPAPGPGGIIPSIAEVSDQKAGSVLIYNVYTSSTDPAKQNTRINLTNTHSLRPAFVHLFFVAEGCSVADSYVCLTANQTTSFLVSDLDPGTTGYLVAVAVDGVRGCPTNFNYLIGDEYVKFASGHAANLGAEAFAALAGGLPVCDANSVTAQLNFDGISYNRLPATLALSNVGSRADGNDTLLIVNRIGGNLGTGASTLGALFGVLYDDAESALSFSVSGNCQLRNSLTNNFPRTTPRFETFIPAGRTGWLKIFNQTGSVGITGAAINFNANAISSAGAFNQGHNLHPLTLNATNGYTIPVFPPSC